MPHESISVFDMLKIGVGQSSSHTLGPWRAALRFINTLKTTVGLAQVKRVSVLLYGSLAKTGKGHGTDIAVSFLRRVKPGTLSPPVSWESLVGWHGLCGMDSTAAW